MTVAFFPGPNFATLTLSGPLTQDVAIELRRSIHLARDYWQYDQLRLEINSPGGELLALRAVAHEMTQWRSSERRLQTLALMQAGSAAALMLSLGDVGTRTVQPFTELLYHHTRVTAQGDQALTALHADATARRLQQSDQALLQEVALHIVQAHGDTQTMARSGIARCKQLETESPALAATLGRHAGFGAGSSRAVGSLLRKIRKAYEAALDKCEAKPYVNLLASIFDHDSRMPVDVAWSLLLIDVVEGISTLRPEPSAPAKAPVAGVGMGAKATAA